MRDEFPGLYPVDVDGRSIEGELYEMTEAILFDSLLPAEPAELEIGTIELDDGQIVNAMQLQPERIADGDPVVDIAELGGWRRYQAHLAANADTRGFLGVVPARVGQLTAPMDSSGAANASTAIVGRACWRGSTSWPPSARTADGGVTRLAFSSPTTSRGRALVGGWMRDAGLEVHVDAGVQPRRPGPAAGCVDADPARQPHRHRGATPARWTAATACSRRSRWSTRCAPTGSAVSR